MLCCKKYGPYGVMDLMNGRASVKTNLTVDSELGCSVTELYILFPISNDET